MYCPYTGVHENPLHMHVQLRLKSSFSVLKRRQVVRITVLSANTISVPVNRRGLHISYRNILHSEREKCKSSSSSVNSEQEKG